MSNFIRAHHVAIWSNLALPAAGEVDSPSMTVRDVVTGHVQASWTGAALTGTLKIQTSLDPVNIGWTDFPGPVAISGPGNAAWNMQNIGFCFMRLVYLPTSGIGVINAQAFNRYSL